MSEGGLLALEALLDLAADPARLRAVERELHALLGGEPHQHEPPSAGVSQMIAAIDTATIATAEDIAAAITMLKNASVPGGTCDPVLVGSDLPWVRLLERLRDRPESGLIIAKRWFAHLFELGYDAEQPLCEHGAAHVLAAFVVAILAGRCGRKAEARRWVLTAEAEAEADELGGDVLRVMLRAVTIARDTPDKLLSSAMTEPKQPQRNTAKWQPPTKAEVKKTIESSGYPLELRTALSTERHGFFTIPNWTWFDPRSQKQRELDVVCQASWFAKKAGVHFHIMIECKTYRTGFLLFHFEANTHDVYDFHHGDLGDSHCWGTPCAVLSREHPGTGSDLWSWSSWGSHRWPPSRNICMQYGVVKSTKDGKPPRWQLEQSEAHEALDGLVASMFVYREQAPCTARGNTHPFLHFAIPLLVVDGPIYVYRKTPSNPRGVLTTVNHATLFRRTATGDGKRRLVRVDVVASRHFDTYLAGLVIDARATSAWIDSNFDLLVESAGTFPPREDGLEAPLVPHEPRALPIRLWRPRPERDPSLGPGPREQSRDDFVHELLRVSPAHQGGGDLVPALDDEPLPEHATRREGLRVDLADREPLFQQHRVEPAGMRRLGDGHPATAASGHRSPSSGGSVTSRATKTRWSYFPLIISAATTATSS